MKKILLLLSIFGCVFPAFSADPRIKPSNAAGLSYLIKTDSTAIVANESEWTTIMRSNYSFATITIPSSFQYGGKTYKVVGIAEDAFIYCENLTEVIIPNTITSIDDGAFESSPKLATINIPSSVKGIGSGILSGTLLYNTESNWQNGVLIIDNCLIDAKTSLSGNYAIKDDVRLIAKSAFAACSSITSITIPKSVSHMGTGVFAECSALTDVTILSRITAIKSSQFSGCTSLKSIFIPNSGIVTIGEEAFKDCISLKSISIPSTVETISKNAFSGCTSLNSITLGRKVKNVTGAFAGCTSLKLITFEGSTPPAVDVISTNPVCYIPCGTLDAYVNSDWRNYCQQFIEQSSLYEIMVESNNNSSGVAKLVSRPDCTSAIITAIPNEGCTFVKWSDGNTQTTRYLELTEDINLTAYFAKEGYTIHVYQDCNITIE